jgi:hypothetical protein
MKPKNMEELNSNNRASIEDFQNQEKEIEEKMNTILLKKNPSLGNISEVYDDPTTEVYDDPNNQ